MNPTYKLQNAALFRGLSPDNLNLTLSHASLRTVPEGAFLFRQGELAKEMFLLASGRVRVQELDVDGRDVLVRFVRPGEVLGDKGAIPGERYGASAISDTRVRIYAWPTAVIVDLLGKVPRLASNLFEITTEYLHYSRERYRLLATSPVERRIHWAVAELAEGFGSAHGTATSITGRALQKDIADLAATTIYSVSRVLRNYEERGLLTRKRGQIVLTPAFQ